MRKLIGQFNYDERGFSQSELMRQTTEDGMDIFRGCLSISEHVDGN